MGNMVYNLNDNAVQVLAGKQIKDNVFMDVLHRNGKGVTEETTTNASTVRMFKMKKFNTDARKLGSSTNGGFFNNGGAEVPEIEEYDLNLLYVYDSMIDLPELQQDLVAVNTFDKAMKNVGGRVATEINASTIAEQVACKFNIVASMTGTKKFDNQCVVLGSGDKAYYEGIMSAQTMLDDGDEDNGIQAYPFDEREILVRPEYRQKLMSTNGVLLGGSNYAQSMLAKGGVDPESSKDFGNMYCGEIDKVPVYICPKTIWNRAKAWLSSTATASVNMVDNVMAMVMSALGTDRGISTPDYVKCVDSPNGAGKRLQPKTRWGINICYPSAIVPILKNGSDATTLTATLSVVAPGSKASE